MENLKGNFGQGRKDKLCDDFECPEEFKAICECLFKAFEEWAEWGDKVAKKQNLHDKCIAKLYREHDWEPETGPGGETPPPPRPPFQ